MYSRAWYRPHATKLLSTIRSEIVWGKTQSELLVWSVILIINNQYWFYGRIYPPTTTKTSITTVNVRTTIIGVELLILFVERSVWIKHNHPLPTPKFVLFCLKFALSTLSTTWEWMGWSLNINNNGELLIFLVGYTCIGQCTWRTQWLSQLNLFPWTMLFHTCFLFLKSYSTTRK